MAKVRYTPYSSRRKSNKNIRHFIISIVLIAAIYFTIKWIWGKEETEAISEQPVVKLAETQDNVRASYDIKTAQPLSDVKEPLNPANKPSQTEEYIKLQAQDTTSLSTSPARKAEPITVPVATQMPVAEVAVEDIDQEDIALNEEAKKLIYEANTDIQNNKLISARFKLNSALRMPLTSVQRENIKRKLAELSAIWLFSSDVLEGDNLCSYYKVQPGDLLSTIGKANNIPWELLLKLNNISRPENLRAGQRIKVVKGPFHAIIDRTNYTMDLYLQQTYVKTYPVGLGKVEHSTPTGMWLVKNDKLISPNWTDPDSGKQYDATDPDYPLGKRWIGLKGLSGDAKGRTGFAIHGTNEPESIGQRSSRGCIRLLDKDVLEVYDLMTPNQSQVQVKD